LCEIKNADAKASAQKCIQRPNGLVPADVDPRAKYGGVRTGMPYLLYCSKVIITIIGKKVNKIFACNYIFCLRRKNYQQRKGALIDLPKVIKYTILFLIGGIGYGGLEMAYRKRTHWSMLLAGGMSFCAINRISELPNRKSWNKWFLGSAAITGIEFVSGLIVNVWLRLNVWDYSGRVFNLKGQVCPLFSCIWFLICIPAMAFCDTMKKIKKKVLRRRLLRRAGLCQALMHRAL
jgi:hypothetical protein